MGYRQGSAPEGAQRLRQRLWWVRVALWLGLFAPWMDTARVAMAADSLSLALHFDAEEYVVNQPILFLIVLENGSRENLTDVAPLDPERRHCTLEVISEPDVKPILESVFSIYDTEFPKGGLTLPSGGALCATGNLLRWFGTRDTENEWIRSLCGQLRLMPGEYRVRARFAAHTRFSTSRGIQQVHVVSGWSAFRVVPRGPGEDAELESLRRTIGLSKAESRTASTRSRAREALQRRIVDMTDSRYFHLAYAIGSFVGANEPDIALVNHLGSHGGRSVGSAWLLADQLTRSEMPDAMKKSWIEHTRRRQKDRLQQVVLQSWLLKLEQRKGYTSFDPAPR